MSAIVERYKTLLFSSVPKAPGLNKRGPAPNTASSRGKNKSSEILNLN